jgi:hypothetical protein
MSNIARIYRAGKYARKAGQKADMRNYVKSFPKSEVNLNDFGEILEEVDLKDPSNQALIISEWLDRPLIFSDYNTATIEKMKWIDLGDFKLSFVPILKEYKGIGVPIQLMFLGKGSLRQDLQISAFGEMNEETMAPDENYLISNAIVSADNLTVVRGAVSKGFTKKEDSSFLLILRTPTGFIQQRIIVNFDYLESSVNDYEELKETRFLGLADEKHIHPRVVKKISQLLLFSVMKVSEQTGMYYIIGSSFVLLICIGLPFAIDPSSDLHEPWTFFIFAMVGFFALIGLYIGIIQLRILSKAKKMRFIPKDTDVMDNIDYEDPMWIRDYCQISDKWVFSEETNTIALKEN